MLIRCRDAFSWWGFGFFVGGTGVNATTGEGLARTCMGRNRLGLGLVRRRLSLRIRSFMCRRFLSRNLSSFRSFIFIHPFILASRSSQGLIYS
jgi:hypothetical protein